MKKYNCVVVFNTCKDKVLLYKRIEEPYKELYNIVGVKVETGENSMDAAYRGLQEETGILKIDGCKGGWIAAVIYDGKLQIEKYASLESTCGSASGI